MKSLKLFLTCLFLVCALPGFSQWSADPENPGLVCDLTGQQNNVKSFADDSGGAFVFWLDTRNNPGFPSREIYGQHYDSEGYALWETNGRLIMDHFNAILAFDIKRTDNGSMMLGMITQGPASGAGDTLRFQMLDNSGGPVWTDQLVVANAAFLPNYILYITSFMFMPVGSEFYVLFEPSYFGGANGTRFSRFDSSGNLLSPYDGIPVGNQSYIGKSGCASASDGTGDFFLYYANGNGSGAELHCYRFSDAGAAIWGPVNVVANTSGLSYQFDGIKDENGITFVWQGSGTGAIDLFARRLTLNGAFAWGGTTVNICSENGSQDNFDLKQKDMYLYVTWADGRPGVDPGYYDIYAQKLDTTGYLYWMPNGIEIASFNTYIPYPMLEVLDEYSIIVNHQSTIAGFMSQKVNNDGSLPWGPEAWQISTSIFNPFYQMHTIFQSGENTLVAWNKAVSGGGSDGVYITKIDISTGLTEPPIDPGFSLFPNPTDEKLEIKISKDIQAESVSLMNATGQLIETREISPSSHEIKVLFNISQLPAGIYFVKLAGKSVVREQKLIIR